MDVRTVIPDPTLLHSTAAVNVTAGVIGGAGSAAGAIGDSLLYTVLILKNAAATLTIVGFAGEDGVARPMVLTGSTTADTFYSFGGLRNTGAPMTLTASAADVVLVGVMGS